MRKNEIDRIICLYCALSLYMLVLHCVVEYACTVLCNCVCLYYATLLCECANEIRVNGESVLYNIGSYV